MIKRIPPSAQGIKHTMVVKRCVSCDEPFEVPAKFARRYSTCSRACSSRRRSDLGWGYAWTKCEVCEKELQVRVAKLERGLFKYCSDECRIVGLNKFQERETTARQREAVLRREGLRPRHRLVHGEATVHHGTPTRHGTDDRTPVAARRTRTPHQRGQGRQPAREPAAVCKSRRAYARGAPRAEPSDARGEAPEECPPAPRTGIRELTYLSAVALALSSSFFSSSLASPAVTNSAAAAVPTMRKRSASHSGPGITWIP